MSKYSDVLVTIIGFLVGVIIGLCVFANDACAQTTTIFAPDGSVTVCQVGSNGIVVCV